MKDSEENGVKAQVKVLFEEKKKQQLLEIKEAESIVRVNTYLQQWNWAFVHPYLVGHDISTFERMEQENTGTTDKVFAVFASYFFDLRHTAYMIDGYFKERPFLAPFCPLIDQSVVMCLQKDYAGAITTLIPVIEGSLRRYLTEYKGKRVEKTLKKDDLLKTFTYLKEGYLEIMRKNYENPGPAPYYLRYDANQIEQLLKNEACYINLWFSIIENFFNHNLYLDTRSGTVEDYLNRHAILHGLDTAIYYNLPNYLRLFHCLHFLSWAFSMGCPNVKYLPDLESEKTYFKWKAFEKIKRINKITDDIKVSLYQSHPDFDANEFKKEWFKSKTEHILDHSLSFTIEMDLANIDALFENFHREGKHNNKKETVIRQRESQ